MFWKKSEDPWDMDPAKRRPAPGAAETPFRQEEPEKGLLDSLRGWANEKLEAQRQEVTQTPEVCPWCGGSMEQGFLNGGNGSVFLLDSLRGWANEKLEAQRQEVTQTPEVCPWCGGSMEQGFLNGGNGSVFWNRGVPDTKTKWLGAGRENVLRVDDEGVLFTYKTAWRCPACEKIVFDAAGLRPEGESTYTASFEEGAETRSPYSGCFGETPEEREE